MPYYNALKDSAITRDERKRTADGLLRLQQQLRKEIPPRSVSDTLLLATWNIRDLGNENKRASERPGSRLNESYYYIAEIISRFDLVAVQEVNTLEALDRIMNILGPSWDHITTDAMQGPGNQERMTFIFDKRKIWFKHVVGQISLPRGEQIDGTGQFARTPFYVAFQAQWFRFSLCTVHIVYGSSTDLTKRVQEVDTLARFLAERVQRTNENMILLGDFNILERGDPIFEALVQNGWDVPPELNFDTDALADKHYDQIAFKVKEGELQLGDSSPHAGAFDFFQSVFLADEWEAYYNIQDERGEPMEAWDNSTSFPSGEPLDRRGYFVEKWRTWQVSDHFPLWIELKIDFTKDYLQRLAYS